MTPKLQHLFERFVVSERQWSRACRIAHARYMLTYSTRPVERKFWIDVLKAYGVPVAQKRNMSQSRPERAAIAA